MTMNMNVSTSWNQPFIVEYLAYQLKKGRLALFLGSGVSQAAGLPNWNDLVRRLMGIAGQPFDPNRNFGQQLEAMRYDYCGGDHDTFVDLLHKGLYETADLTFDSLSQLPLLRAIGALVMASSRGRAGQVVTLNFDDVLETYLRYYGYTVNAAKTALHWAGNHDVNVYHPHGFLPYNTNDLRTKGDRFVLDEESYLNVLGNEAESWNQMVQSIVRTHTCLWIGLSGNDSHIQQWFLKAKTEHAAREDQTALYHAVRFTSKPEEVGDSYWLDGRKVYNLCVNNVDLPRLLLEICQKASAE